jgi:hypothetical protein
MREQKDIDDQINRAMDSVETGSSNWPHMTYEDGVVAALRWVVNESDEPPMDDE